MSVTTPGQEKFDTSIKDEIINLAERYSARPTDPEILYDKAVYALEGASNAIESSDPAYSLTEEELKDLTHFIKEDLSKNFDEIPEAVLASCHRAAAKLEDHLINIAESKRENIKAGAPLSETDIVEDAAAMRALRLILERNAVDSSYTYMRRLSDDELIEIERGSEASLGEDALSFVTHLRHAYGLPKMGLFIDREVGTVIDEADDDTVQLVVTYYLKGDGVVIPIIVESRESEDFPAESDDVEPTWHTYKDVTVGPFMTEDSFVSWKRSDELVEALAPSKEAQQSLLLVLADLAGQISSEADGGVQIDIDIKGVDTKATLKKLADMDLPDTVTFTGGIQFER